jgi:hypothetical protein
MRLILKRENCLGEATALLHSFDIHCLEIAIEIALKNKAAVILADTSAECASHIIHPQRTNFNAAIATVQSGRV